MRGLFLAHQRTRHLSNIGFLSDSPALVLHPVILVVVVSFVRPFHLLCCNGDLHIVFSVTFTPGLLSPPDSTVDLSRCFITRGWEWYNVTTRKSKGDEGICFTDWMMGLYFIIPFHRGLFYSFPSKTAPGGVWFPLVSLSLNPTLAPHSWPVAAAGAKLDFPHCPMYRITRRWPGWQTSLAGWLVAIIYRGAVSYKGGGKTRPIDTENRVSRRLFIWIVSPLRIGLDIKMFKLCDAGDDEGDTSLKTPCLRNLVIKENYYYGRWFWPDTLLCKQWICSTSMSNIKCFPSESLYYYLMPIINWSTGNILFHPEYQAVCLGGCGWFYTPPSYTLLCIYRASMVGQRIIW